MAVILKDEYPGRVIIDSNNPDGTFKNRTDDILKDGTPLNDKWTKDIWGYFQYMLNRTGIVPNGSEENINNSQHFEALETVIKALSGVNFIVNGGFQINQLETTTVTAVNNTYQGCDMWITAKTAIASVVDVNTTNLPSNLRVNQCYGISCSEISPVSGSMGLKQKIERFEDFGSKTVTFSCYIRSNSSNARLVLQDGVTTTTSSPHPGDNNWHLLSVTKTCSGSISELTAYYMIVAADGVGNVSIAPAKYLYGSGALLILGSVPGFFQSKSYGADLAECQRYFYRIKSESGEFRRFATGAFEAASTLRFILLYPQELFKLPAISYSNIVAITYPKSGVGPVALSNLTFVSNKSNRYADLEGDTSPTTNTIGDAVTILLSGANYIDFDARL